MFEKPSTLIVCTCMLIACTKNCIVAVSIYSLHMHAHGMHSRLHPGMYDLQIAQWGCNRVCTIYNLGKRLRHDLHAQEISHSKQGNCLCNDIESSQSPRSLDFEFEI